MADFFVEWRLARGLAYNGRIKGFELRGYGQRGVSLGIPLGFGYTGLGYTCGWNAFGRWVYFGVERGQVASGLGHTWKWSVVGG